MLNPFLTPSHQFDGYRNVEGMTFVPGDITMSKLKNKVAVVTGASKGIGAGIAKGLAAEGASVVVNYSSSREGADRVVADIKSKGGKAIAVQGDVGKAEDVKKIFAETEKAFGRLDVL